MTPSLVLPGMAYQGWEPSIPGVFNKGALSVENFKGVIKPAKSPCAFCHRPVLTVLH